MEYLRRPPGANEVALARVEVKFGISLPHDVKTFWSESNGPIIDFGYKELQFFPAEDIAAEDVYQLAHYMPGAIPLCMDGNGNLCLARIDEGSLLDILFLLAAILGGTRPQNWLVHFRSSCMTRPHQKVGYMPNTAVKRDCGSGVASPANRFCAAAPYLQR